MGYPSRGVSRAGYGTVFRQAAVMSIPWNIPWKHPGWILVTVPIMLVVVDYCLIVDVSLEGERGKEFEAKTRDSRLAEVLHIGTSVGWPGTWQIR